MFVRLNDPVVQVKIGDRWINAPLSHNIPNLLSEYPLYDRALARIAKRLKHECGYLRMIDVGANIGDTVNIVDQSVHGHFLCVEPTRTFFELLKQNTSSIKNVILENIAVGECDSTVSSHMEEHRGSARVTESQKESAIRVATIDSLVQKHPEFKQANLFKIDTDGYDYKVIRGAVSLLQQGRPPIFFEVSPDHLIHVGKEDPVSIFPFLAEMGYTNFLFYDWHGYPIAPLGELRMDTICGLVGYANRKPSFWLDVLAFHHTQADLFRTIVDQELRAIPPYVRPYFKQSATL